MRLPPRLNMQPLSEPIATDVDSSITAIHHTLGFNAFQASPGSHRHDGSDSHRIRLSDMQGVSVSYQPQGGTIGGTQPTFSGDPLITGSYTKIGNLVFFQIDVDFSNITDFGTGQYYLTMPFETEHDMVTRQGYLKDVSTGRSYAISGHAAPGSNVIELFGLQPNGLDESFTYNTPVALNVADSFHVAGIYEIMQEIV